MPAPLRLPGRRALAIATLSACGLASATSACSPRLSREQADREVYKELHARRTKVPLASGTLDLDRADAAARPARDAKEVDLDLDGTVRLAATASREYRRRREDVYLSALALTETRNRYRFKLDVGLSADATVGPGTRSLSASPGAALSRDLEAGGAFVLELAATFVRNLSTDPVETAMTTLAATLPSLPLSGAAAGAAARESLTQAERDVLYELRAYTRFQQEFTVEVASAYYRVLLQRDVVENEARTETSLADVAERTKALGPAGAGRLPGIQVDQAAQDLLRARDRRVRAESGYRDALDRFKITLGLPVPTVVRPKGGDLERLEGDVLAPDETPVRGTKEVRDAVAIALVSRLDLANARDALQDAQRLLALAKQGLAPDATLRLGSPSASTPSTRPLDARGATAGDTTLGIDLSLPTNRVPQRNAYRAAEIEVERARRGLEEQEDEVRAQVRRAWRAVELARRSWEIQKQGVALAATRVDSAYENLKEGRAITRDVLEAENSRIEAANALTSALVDYAVAKLELERDLGTLRPDAPLVSK